MSSIKLAKCFAVALFVVALSACGTSTPAAPPTVASAPAPTAATAAQPIVLKHASSLVTGLALSEAHVWFWKEVEARSKGRLRVEFYWAESLAKAPDILEAVKSGLADTGEVISVYHPAKTPLTTIQGLPFLQVSAYEVALATAALDAQLPEARAELANHNAKFLYSEGMNTYTLFTKKPVRKLEDLKGMKIRGAGDLNTWVSAAGGTSVAMTFPEMYTGLERGMIEGTLHGYSTARAYKWQEVVKYATDAKAGAVGNNSVVINLAAWNKLPPDIQKIITDLAEKEWPKKIGDMITADESESMKAVLAAGVEKIDLSKEEWKRWEALAQPIWNKWVDDKEKAGLPGKKALEIWQKALDKAR